MAIYAVWNNKGGVGKSYLTFQIACEYARTHPEQPILVIDLCPQANASSMLLGGITNGEKHLVDLAMRNPRRTIAGYIDERIVSPYLSPKKGGGFALKVYDYNKAAPKNLFLVVGDEALEIQTLVSPKQLTLAQTMRGVLFTVGSATLSPTSDIPGM